MSLTFKEIVLKFWSEASEVMFAPDENGVYIDYEELSKTVDKNFFNNQVVELKKLHDQFLPFAAKYLNDEEIGGYKFFYKMWETLKYVDYHNDDRYLTQTAMIVYSRGVYLEALSSLLSDIILNVLHKNSVDADIKELNRIYRHLLTLEQYNWNSSEGMFDEKKLNTLKGNVVELRNFGEITPSNTTNENEHIFCNNGFELFKLLEQRMIKPVGERGHQSDVIYCFHRMRNIDDEPKYIHQNISEFLKWYNSRNDDDISQSKTFDEVRNDSRKRNYNLVLDSFK